MPVHAHVAVDPIHAALIDVPIVVPTRRPSPRSPGTRSPASRRWYRAAFCASVASVAIALVAVVPAIADLVGLTASPRWCRLGFRHAACNVVALIAFSAAGAAICTDYARLHELDVAAPLVLASVGLVAAIIAAWLGWTMLALLGAWMASARIASARIASARIASDDWSSPACRHRATQGANQGARRTVDATSSRCGTRGNRSPSVWPRCTPACAAAAPSAA